MLEWLFPEPRHGKPVRTTIRRARSIDIARCRDGDRQRITGVVEGAMPLTSPVTGRPCVFWAVSIDEVGAGDWVERGVADQGVPFFVRDRSGLARVVPDQARCDLAAMSTTYSAAGQALPPGPRALFETLAITLNYPTTSKVRFNERIVTTGETITLFGQSQLEPLQDASAADVDATGYRGELPMRPVFSSSRRKPLLIGTP